MFTIAIAHPRVSYPIALDENVPSEAYANYRLKRFLAVAPKGWSGQVIRTLGPEHTPTIRLPTLGVHS